MKQLILPVLFLAACGGSDEQLGDDTPPGPDAAVDPDGGDEPVTSRVAAVAGDFVATGILSTVDAPSLEVDTGVVAGVAGSDPAIRRIGDELFIVNRFGGDNITIVDATTFALVDQIATGADSNPQDVAQVGGKLYVPALGADSLLVIDRASPQTIDEIDLSTLDDDGFPDCVAAHAVGTRVFVACSLLDNFSADVAGKLVVIDTSDDSVAHTIDLPSRNPVGWFFEDGATLYLATVPDYQDYTEGCLVEVTTAPTPAATCAITNDSVDGYLSKLTHAGDQVWGVHFAYDAEFNGSGALVAVDLEGGTIGTPLDAAGVLATDLAGCGPHVYVADKAMDAQGIRVYQTDGTGVDELTTDPLDIGLPPAFGNGLACADL